MPTPGTYLFQHGFEDGTTGPFKIVGTSSEVTVVSDPTPRASGKVVKITYNAAPSGSADKYIYAFFPNTTCGYGAVLYTKSKFYYKSSTDPNYDSTDNYKTVDFLGSATSRLTLHRVGAGGALLCSVIQGGSDVDTDTGIRFADDTWYALKTKITMHSASGVADGRLDLYVDGATTPTYTRTGLLFEPSGPPTFNIIHFGSQWTNNDPVNTYTVTRYFDDCFVSLIDPDDITLPTVYVSDDFIRADSATSLGTADTGQVWTPFGGTTPGISGNQAYFTNAVVNAGAVVESSQSDYRVSEVLGPQAASSAMIGIVFRYVDANNWSGLRPFSGHVLLKQCVAGVITNTDLGAPAAGLDAHDVLLAECEGDTVRCYLSNVLLYTATDTTRGTKVGLLNYNVDTIARAGKFRATALVGATGSTATQLLLSQQPAGAVSGMTLTTQPAGTVADSGGSTVTSDTSTVTASWVPVSGDAEASGTLSTVASAGDWAFTDLALTWTVPSQGRWRFSRAGLPDVDSDLITLSVSVPGSGARRLRGVSFPVLGRR